MEYRNGFYWAKLKEEDKMEIAECIVEHGETKWQFVKYSDLITTDDVYYIGGKVGLETVNNIVDKTSQIPDKEVESEKVGYKKGYTDGWLEGYDNA